MIKHWLTIGTAIILLLVSGAVFSSTNLVITIYNNIIGSKTQVERAVSDLDAAYQRRYALVGNFVAIVQETKGFEKYQIEIEKELLPRIAAAKASATKMDIALPTQMAQRLDREAGLNNAILAALDKLLVIAPHYPQITDPMLKDRAATFNALKDLRASLESLEDDIQYKRQTINQAVQSYNRDIQLFPANLFASSWGFDVMKGFEKVSEEASHDVKVEF